MILAWASPLKNEEKLKDRKLQFGVFKIPNI